MTGYLTQRGESSGNRYNLVIPNREIRNIITNHILKMFKENVRTMEKQSAIYVMHC